MTAFIERTVDFYLDYLSANNSGLFLPTSIKSYLDGRLGQLEELMSSIAFRQAAAQLRCCSSSFPPGRRPGGVSQKPFWSGWQTAVGSAAAQAGRRRAGIA